MSVVKQLAKEFWFPLVTAILWTMYNVYTDSAPWSFARIINIFGPLFFLISWSTAQYFRVRKQTRVENDLKNIHQTTVNLLDELGRRTADLVSHVTGGQSFCYLLISNLSDETNSGFITVLHSGDHVLYDVVARICDLQIFHKVAGAATFSSICNSEIHRTFGNLVPKSGVGSEVWDLGETDRRDFNIFWWARNGPFIQPLRFRKVQGRWMCATKVVRNEAVIFERVDENYPRNADGDVDW